jgi:3-polyprenyl-4-hydroxybenzoate decarboxylase
MGNSSGSSKRLVLGVGGSSGSLYAKVLMDDLAGPLRNQWDRVGVVMSDNAKYNWQLELGSESYKDYPFDFL